MPGVSEPGGTWLLPGLLGCAAWHEAKVRARATASFVFTRNPLGYPSRIEPRLLGFEHPGAQRFRAERRSPLDSIIDPFPTPRSTHFQARTVGVRSIEVLGDLSNTLRVRRMTLDGCAA